MPRHPAHIVSTFAVALLLSGPALAFSITGQQAPTQVTDHDPNDLRTKGAISWDTLRELDLTYETAGPGMTSYTQSFTSDLLKLDGTHVKLVGFLYPIEAGEAHQHFLLSAFPPSCPF